MNIPPPPPPLTILHVSEQTKENNFVFGKFEYIQNNSDRQILYTAYSAISITETWDYIHNLSSDYSLNSPEMKSIINTIETLGYFGHSGSSFMIVINTMRFISQNGELEFKKQYKNIF